MRRQWTAKRVEELQRLLTFMLLIQVDVDLVPGDNCVGDGDDHNPCPEWDSIRLKTPVGSIRPDWVKAMQISADIVAKLDLERTSKLRVPEAEPFRLTDAEWNFANAYFEDSPKPKTPAERKRFERLLKKLNVYLLYFAVYAHPPRGMSRNS